jgi:hypothetical protein
MSQLHEYVPQLVYTFILNHQMHIYKHIQLHIITHQHVSATPVTFIRVSYKKTTINIQILTYLLRGAESFLRS